MSESPFGPPVQIAYAVADVTASAVRWAEATGVGPFFVAEHIGMEAARVGGVDRGFDHSSAFAQWGPVMVELVHEHSAPAIGPASGLHHLAFFVQNLGASIEWCTDRDWPEVLRASVTGGLQFAFCDARHELGHLVELYEPSDRLVGMYETVATASRDWDGTNVLRHFG